MENVHMESKKVGVAAVSLILVTGLALPAVAHGENDARALFRDVEVGPYVVTLWQVIGDQDSLLPPHLIVAFGGEVPSASDSVKVFVDDDPLAASPSSSLSGSWETPSSARPDQVVTVAIETSDGQWMSPGVTVPELLGSRVPIELLLAVAVFFTTAAAFWLARRTLRVVRYAMILGMNKR
jgi:hypothetical protein